MVLAVALAVVVGAFVASLTVDRGAAAVPAKSRHEVHWPDDLALIAHRVEAIRGLKFRHAVRVRYLHMPTSAASPSALSDRARAALTTVLEPYVAFGLVNGQNDVATLTDGGSESIAGLYSTESHRIRVFVRPHTPFATEVVAHELTHALEDQHFPERTRPELRSVSQASAEKAVVEGSASLVEHRYVARYPSLSVLPGARPAVGSGAETFVRNWEFFAVQSGAAYSLGPAYVDATLARGDVTWDKLVAFPPLSDAAIVDPLAPGSVWQATSPPSTLVPELTAIDVFLLLASRVEPAAALDAVTHSSGATFSGYERDGRRCADLALVSKVPNDPVVIRTLDQWVAAAGPANASRSEVPIGRSLVLTPSTGRPGSGPTTLLVKPGSPLLTSCAGVSVAPFGSFAIPGWQLAARNAVIADALRHGIDESAAACIGRAVLTDARYRSSLQRSLDDFSEPSDEARARVARRAAKACGTNV